MITHRPGRFAVDGIGVEFSGFTTGDLWNGWACPVFTRQVAEQILVASEINGYHWQYDSATNAFEVRHEDDPNDFEPQTFNGIIIALDDGSSAETYPIGAYSWTWSEVG